ncbi:MAG: hypothetical protein AAGH17_01610 [Pseudomonadota bacterium]
MRRFSEVLLVALTLPSFASAQAVQPLDISRSLPQISTETVLIGGLGLLGIIAIIGGDDDDGGTSGTSATSGTD